MKYILFLIVILFSNQAVALDCSKQPTCAELGYSTEDNQNCLADGYLICPFDSNYKKCVNFNCESLGFTNNDKTSWCKNIAVCPGNKDYTACIKATCEIGDVYYSDGSCGLVDDYNGSKTPVGIVYFEEEGGYHGRVMALNGLTGDENHNFDPKNPFHNTNNPLVQGFELYDVPAIQNVTTLLSSRLNGQEETRILAQTVMPDCPYHEGTSDYHWYCVGTQARATLAFYPPDTDADNPYVGAGHWYQPAIGELMLLNKNEAWEKVFKTVDALKEAGVDASYPCDKDTQFQWKRCTSTTEYSHLAYEIDINKGVANGGRDTGGEIRPILAY